MIESQPGYVLLTDAPPLSEGGHGCCVLAWNWLQAMSANVRLVVTHRLMRQVELSAISAGSPAPVVFYPDLARVSGAGRFTRLHSLVELGLFFLASRRISRAIRDSSANRILAFFGGDPWFLLIAWFLAWRTGLPLDIYLVDDLEEYCRVNGRSVLARFVRWLEPLVLSRAERVFVISPGYVEHIRAKYGLTCIWLPISFRVQELKYHPFKAPVPDVRTLAYVGAVNPLYLSALKELLEDVALWNKTADSFKLKISLLTYSEAPGVEKDLAGFSDWEIRYRLSTEQRERVLRESWAVFVPYSFDPSVRLMVSTSFPSRLTECMTAGRPLLVYGPPHATLPKYFLANNLPLCAQSRSELKTALRTIGDFDSPELIAKYQNVVNHYHSPGAIAARMSVAPIMSASQCVSGY